jgi:hypothetical protein
MKRRRTVPEGSRLAEQPRRLELPPQPASISATRPDGQARARLERHLRSIEGLPAPLARDLAARRAQAWAHRMRLRKQDSRSLRDRPREPDSDPSKAA